MKGESLKDSRENNIDEAISPPFPQVQCISITPETELQREGGEERGKEKSGRKVLWEKYMYISERCTLMRQFN